jgi:hypothetical protein
MAQLSLDGRRRIFLRIDSEPEDKIVFDVPFVRLVIRVSMHIATGAVPGSQSDRVFCLPLGC